MKKGSPDNDIICRSTETSSYRWLTREHTYNSHKVSDITLSRQRKHSTHFHQNVILQRIISTLWESHYTAQYLSRSPFSLRVCSASISSTRDPTRLWNGSHDDLVQSTLHTLQKPAKERVREIDQVNDPQLRSYLPVLDVKSLGYTRVLQHHTMNHGPGSPYSPALVAYMSFSSFSLASQRHGDEPCRAECSDMCCKGLSMVVVFAEKHVSISTPRNLKYIDPLLQVLLLYSFWITLCRIRYMSSLQMECKIKTRYGPEIA
jgi:hypothetical protein